MNQKYFMPYQLAWIKDKSNAMLGDKGRRIGLTYADSYKSVRERNIIDHRRDLWFSSADETAAVEYSLSCQQWAKITKAVIKEFTEELEDDKGYKFNNYVVEFPNGSRINCMTSNPRRFRSKGGDVVLDEFDWHDKPGEMLDAAMPTTTWGYNLRILTTRNGEGSEFDKLVAVAKKILSGELDPTRDPVMNWSYHFIPITVAIEQGLAEKIYKLNRVDPEARKRFLRECRARARNEDTFNQEYMCIPSAVTSTLIPYDLYFSCQSDDCLGPIGKGDCYLGFDVGREKDPTEIWIAERVGDVLVIRKTITLLKQPYGVQKQVIADELQNPRILRACGDASGIGDMLVEELQRKFGENRVEKVKFTGPVKEHLAGLAVGYMEDRRVRLPDDPKARESFHKVKKTTTAAGNPRFDATRDAEGHADKFWAFTLMLEAAHLNVGKPQIIWM